MPESIRSAGDGLPSPTSRAWTRAGLVVSAAILSLAAAEIATRLFFPQNLSGSWLMPGPGYNLNRPRAFARHAIDGREARYEVNELGLRGAAPRAARVRVLVVGDSFTFGWLLNDADTYVAKLDARALRAWGPRNVEFMNAAVGGWGTGDYVAFVEDRAAAYEPRAILVFLNSFDVSRTAAAGLWRLTADSAQVERERPATSAGVLRSIGQVAGYQYLLEHSHLVQLARQRVIQSVNQSPDYAQSDAASDKASDAASALVLAQRLFQRLKAWCDHRGVELWVITSGFPAAAGSGDQLFGQQAGAFFTQLQVPFLDLGPALQANSDRSLESLRIPEDGHPNEAASRLIAETAWPWLEAQLTPQLARTP